MGSDPEVLLAHSKLESGFIRDYSGNMVKLGEVRSGGLWS